VWLLPSWNRPQNVQRAVESFPDVEVCLWRTPGDPQAAAYDAIKLPAKWVVRYGVKGDRVGQIFNGFFRAYPNAPFYGFIGDDVVPSPADWNSQLEEAAGGHFIAYPRDSIHEDRLCPHFCIGGDLVREVGALALPGLWHSYIDTVWYNLGEVAELLRYVPSVQFKHYHPLDKSARMDVVYRRGQETHAQDKRTYEFWLKFLAPKLMTEIRRTFGDPNAPEICSCEALPASAVADLSGSDARVCASGGQGKRRSAWFGNTVQ